LLGDHRQGGQCRYQHHNQHHADYQDLLQRLSSLGIISVVRPGCSWKAAVRLPSLETRRIVTVFLMQTSQLVRFSDLES
jgi:hypothetical protein